MSIVPGFRPERAVIASASNGGRYACEIAEVPPLGLVGKYASGTLSDGFPAFSWGKVDMSRKSMERGFSVRSPDDIGTFLANRKRAHPAPRVVHDSRAAEVSQLRRRFPAIIGDLLDSGSLKAPESGWTVPECFGAVFETHPPTLAGEKIPLMEAFARGDMGTFGALETEPLDALTNWSLCIQKRATRNRAAAAYSDGVIVAKYPLDEARALWIIQRRLPRGQQRETVMAVYPIGTTVFLD